MRTVASKALMKRKDPTIYASKTCEAENQNLVDIRFLFGYKYNFNVYIRRGTKRLDRNLRKRIVTKLVSTAKKKKLPSSQPNIDYAAVEICNQNRTNWSKKQGEIQIMP